MNNNELNKHWSDSLSYRPNLNLSEKKVESQEGISQILSDNTKEYSSSLKNYLENNSLITLQSLSDAVSYNEAVSENVLKIINNIDSDFMEYINEDNQEKLSQIISDNIGIDGNIAYEIYNIINENNNTIKELYSSYKNSYYTDKNDNEIENYNEALIQALIEYEEEGKIEKINYAALNVDSYLNSTISSYCEKTIQSNNTLYNMLTPYESTINTTDKDSVNSVIINKYNDNITSYINKYNTCLSQVKSKDCINKFNEICNKRKAMIESINAESSIDLSKQSSYRTLIMNIKKDSVNNVLNSINDLAKIFIMENEMKNDYQITIADREYYKSIYRDTK